MLAIACFVFGFIFFATTVMREPNNTNAVSADGIVVLTGGQKRISEGSRLLKLKLGKRLLISGVNPKTTKEDVIAISGLEPEEFTCCVDLGYEALNTPGNAQEASIWARQKNFQSLIVVTSSYHMPRSLAELARQMPQTKLIAHPVLPPNFRTTVWWLNPNAARVILSEYLKYIPAAAQLAATRYFSGWSYTTKHDDGHASVAKTVNTDQ